MGKMVTLLCLVCLCWTAAAPAQVDPDSDSIGIYFDADAYIYCVNEDFGVQLNAYLCLTRASAQSGVSAWEALVEVTSDTSVLGWNLRGQAVNSTTPPEFVVQMTESFPWASSIVLLEIPCSVATAHPIVFRIHPVSDPTITTTPFPLPAYAAGDNSSDYRSLGYSWGWDPVTGIPNWCAVVNPAGDCLDDPTETETTSWGKIKALYQ